LIVIVPPSAPVWAPALPLSPPAGTLVVAAGALVVVAAAGADELPDAVLPSSDEQAATARIATMAASARRSSRFTSADTEDRAVRFT
jgi:hypothetical protein